MYKEILDAIKKLSEARYEIEGRTEKEKRPLTAKEVGLVAEIDAEINEQRKHLPANKPLSLDFSGWGNTQAVNTRRPGRDFRSMFGIEKGQSLDHGGFKNVNEFLTVLSSGRYDPRLSQIKNAMGETVPSSGGFDVPEEFAAWLLDASLESEIVRPRATVWPMKSESLKVPGWDSNVHSSSLFGGLTATWVAESGSNTEVFAKMRQIILMAKKLACFTAASNELVADGIDFETQIQTAMIKTMSFYLDYAFIQGTGAGQPLGILNDPALITVAKEAGQKAATVIFENCCNMYARLAPQCMANAVWIANQTCVPTMLTMSLAVGLGGAPIQPAVLQSNGQFSLLGKPVLFTEKCPAVGSAGQLILVDLSQYTIGMRKEISMDKSIHVGWSTDEACYRTIIRVDGQGTWDKPITPKAGSTLSWCVALAA